VAVCLPLISPLAPQSPEDFFWHWLTWEASEKGS